MDRRNFIKGMAASALAGIVGGRMQTANAASKGPNIIVMIADNLGWTDLGCYGDPTAVSPSLDRMAEGGVRFTNAFVTAPSCSPSRASIITGCSPHTVDVLGLTHLDPKFQLNTKVPTLPKVLKGGGFDTAIDGKQHIAPFKPISTYGYLNHLEMYEINDSDEACKFISSSKDRPFYLEMNFMQTHRPALHGKGNEFKQHPDFPINPDTVKIPDYWNLPDWPEIKEDVAAYYSQAAAMDAIIGEVMDHLEKEGKLQNTLIVFVSDNGPMYPGMIGGCHDRGIATPLILHWPGGLPEGGVIDGLVSTIDIMPTCLDAVGAPIPESVQGKSILSLARGLTPDIHDEIFAEMTNHVEYTPMRVIRTKKYKYIENLNDTPIGLDMCEGFDWAKRVAELPEQSCCRPRPPEELYDLVADPNELNNIADDPKMAEVKKNLIAKLHDWRLRTRDPLEV